jgi:uncharacterized protein YnzC (UPF0291/DUF896 family)
MVLLVLDLEVARGTVVVQVDNVHIVDELGQLSV